MINSNFFVNKQFSEPAKKAYNEAWTLLRRKLVSGDHLEGKLSASALSTATAVFTLYILDKKGYAESIRRGLAWLADTVCEDGGFGDTSDSIANLSTTLLVYGAVTAAGKDFLPDGKLKGKIENWIVKRTGSIKPADLAAAVLNHYGNDRTFSVPILAMCAMSGVLGGRECWNMIPQLPYELALLPRGLFKFLKLDVVSYALPALIAIGMVRFKHGKRRSTPLTFIRNIFEKRLLKLLKGLQPEGGGFLEAVPLTSFVCMSLIFSGYQDHQVVREGKRFLEKSQYNDGSWPIDSNLATWLTSLSFKSLDAGNKQGILEPGEFKAICKWLLDRQFTGPHPFTGAKKGGWGWTGLPGSVPDADDTSGALTALYRFSDDISSYSSRAREGVRWLLDLQNSDGGLPTFCRGWGQLAFDKSCPDITAHALTAWNLWQPYMPRRLGKRVTGGSRKALRYLERSISKEGYFLPLWFGNQKDDEHHNPVYGTSCVLKALGELDREVYPECLSLIERSAKWLVSVQNSDGGWGGNKNISSSIEETSLATASLIMNGCYGEAAEKGIKWLLDRTNKGKEFTAVPIGLYFASLWYSEELYPVLFFLQALFSYLRH